MPSKAGQPFLLAALLLAAPGALYASEISTLFTTPEERQIINSNRYKTDEPRPVETEPEEEVVELAIQQMVMEEVAVSYNVSGITLTSDGPPMVWINNVYYEDGDQLDDNSRITVMTGAEIKVRITTPDGQHHYATSGETLEVTYLAPLQN